MAEENIIQTNIVANSDMSGLITDLNKVSLALSKLQEQLNVSNKNLSMQISAMNRTFSETLRSTGQFSTHFVSLTSDVDKFGQQLDRGQLKLSQFFRVYGQHAKTSGGLIRDLAKQQVQLQNAILQPLGRNAEGLMQYNVQIPRGLDLVKNKTALVRQELAIMNKVVQEGANQLINWGKNTQWAGRQLTVGLTVPMAAFGKASADAFKTADEQLVRLTKVYGGLAQTSNAELQKVRKDVAKTATELSKGYGASFTDTLALAADIAATGKQGNELLGSVKETTRLAVLGEVDRQDAMKATLAIQTAFKQNTTQLSESINFLNAVENQTSTTLQDLIEAIPKAGPIIKGLGGSVQDLALYLTAMKEGGVNAAEGANALKSALGALINPTKVATNMFAGFGIDLKGIVTKNAGNLTGTLLELQAALDKLNPLQKQQALEQLFGKFQFARMNALFSNLGKQGSQTLQVLDLMKASSQDLANIASRELSQVTESASGKYRRAVEGLKADLAGIGEQFLRINTVLINIVDGVIKFADKLPKPVKQLLSIMGMLTATAGPLIMLTGVLGNFFGYIIKGVYHFKSLFKGAEGWKLLTPEILAASKAGDLAEQTFYSDAKAAAILKQALDGLIGSYTTLETKINAGVINVPTGVGTVGREVNPQHPLLSPKDTRSMSHLNPVSKMSAESKMAQTMFGVVPGAPLVNQKIGGAPQIYMTGDLPKVQGLTSVGGVSTGVVAEEAAKWHAMTSALAMQSKTEIAKLKTEVANTGLITDELSTSYQALLPKMTELTTKAATESAAIVAEMQANKITVDQARAKIVALNAEIEAMMGQTATQVAGELGRNIDVTKVPLLNQPIVDPRTGKSNMKELLKPGRTRGLLNKIAGVLGVKTYGAPYSIETTRPKRFATGGDVFYNNGDQVPGPNVNADVVPAMLTPGEFVIRRDVAQQDPAGMKALNAGQAMIVPLNSGGKVPGYINGGGVLAFLRTMRGSQRPMIAKSLIDRVWPGRLTQRAQAPFYEPKGNVGAFGGAFVNKEGNLVTTSAVNKAMEGIGVDPKTLLASINARGGGSRLSTDVFLDGLVQSGIITAAEKRVLSKKVFNEYASEILRMPQVNDRNNPIWSVSNRVLGRELSNNPEAIQFWQEYSRMPGSFAHPTRRSSTAFLNEITLGSRTVNFANLEASGKNKFYHAKESSNPFISLIERLISTGGGSFVARNRGGRIPGYAGGGGVLSKFGVLKRLGALFSTNEGGRGYSINALPMRPNLSMFSLLPISYKAKKYLYNELVHDVVNRSGQTMGTVASGRMTQYGRMSKTVQGFGHKDQYSIWQSVAGILKDNPNLSPNDRAFFDKVGYTQMEMPYKISKGVLGLNRGGMVPGYAGGGGVAGALATNILPMFAPTIGGAIGSRVAGGAGQAVGQGLGTAVMFGSFLLPMLKQFREVARAEQDVATKTGLFGRAMGGLRAAAGWLGPWGIATTAALSGIAVAYIKIKQHSEEVAKTNRLAFAGAIQPLTSFDEKLKNVKQGLADTNAKNKEFIASHTGAGIPGVAMTVKQFTELQDKVKQTYPQIIKLFEQTPSTKLTEVVTGIKAQLIAAGDSADQANAKIAAMLSQTDKKTQTGSVLMSTQVQGIKDLETSANAMLNFLSKAQARGGSKDFIESLTQTFSTLDTSFKRLSVKGGTVDAINKQFDAISKSQSNGLKITEQQINELAKANPILAGMLSTSDSIADVYAKWRIAISGVTKDLSGLSSSQLQDIARWSSGVTDYFTKTADVASTKAQSGPLASLAKNIATYNKNQKAMQDASTNSAQKQISSIKDQIKLKEKQIQQIQDEANARKKALQEQQQQEDVKLQIQQEQLNYQNALASGDMTTAAQAQLNIQRLVGQQQRTMAESAIDAQAQQKIDTLKTAIDKLNAQGETVTNKPSYTAKESPLTKIYADLNSLLSKISLNGGIISAQDQQLFDSLIMQLNALNPKEAKKISPSFSNKGLPSGMKTAPGPSDLLNLGTSTGYDLSGLTNKAMDAVATNTSITNTKLDEIKAVLKGSPEAGSFTSKIKVTQGSDYIYGQGKVTSYTVSGAELTAAGISYAKGTKFKVGGKEYQIVGDPEYGTGNIKVKPIGKADGGKIFGPGSATSDSIPAMLSNGEYVINAASASKFGYGNLDKINGMAMGGLVRYDIPSMNKLKMASGGMAVSGDTISVGGINMTFNQLPENPRQFGRDIMSGIQDIKIGRNRLIQSA